MIHQETIARVMIVALDSLPFRTFTLLNLLLERAQLASLSQR
jgi:hypothetical protein